MSSVSFSRLRRAAAGTACILAAASFAAPPSFAGGLSNWFRTTPGGNEISEEYGTLYFTAKNGVTRIEGLDAWYFYRGSVVGTLKGPAAAFVADEKSGRTVFFPDRAQWRHSCSLLSVPFFGEPFPREVPA